MAHDENPFAPSAAAEADDHTERLDALEPVAMDVGEILSRCWLVFTTNIGVVLAAVAALIAPAFIFGASGAAIDIVGQSMSGNAQTALQFVGLGNSILQQLVTLFLTLGAVRIFIHVTRGQEASAAMIVGEGRAFLPAIAAQLLIGLALVVSLSPGLAAFGAAAAGLMGLETAMLMFMGNVFVIILPWMILGIGLQFVQYVIVDRGVGPIDAIRESWRLTDGYKMTIFGINLLAGILGLLVTCLTLGIGYLVILPVFVLMQGVMYHSLTHYQGLVDDPW
jgi:hypothetical protein